MIVSKGLVRRVTLILNTVFELFFPILCFPRDGRRSFEKQKDTTLILNFLQVRGTCHAASKSVNTSRSCGNPRKKVDAKINQI